MKRKTSHTAIAIGTLAWCSLGAHAGPSKTAEIETEIRHYLLKKGEITRFELTDARGKCVPLYGHLADDAEIYSYGVDLALGRNEGKLSYLICVQVESDGTFDVEYLPED
nr:hypothetical protein [Hyphomonas sp. Mor2]